MFAGSDQGARGDDYIVFHHRAVHNGCAHAHQYPIPHRTAVQGGVVAYGHIAADLQGPTVAVVGSGMGDVQHTAVLNAASRTDRDPVHVTADSDLGPHGDIITQGYLPQNHGTGVDQDALADLWRLAAKTAEIDAVVMSPC